METAGLLLQDLSEFWDSIAGSAYDPGPKVPTFLLPSGLTSDFGQTLTPDGHFQGIEWILEGKV